MFSSAASEMVSPLDTAAERLLWSGRQLFRYCNKALKSNSALASIGEHVG